MTRSSSLVAALCLCLTLAACERKSEQPATSAASGPSKVAKAVEAMRQGLRAAAPDVERIALVVTLTVAYGDMKPEEADGKFDSVIGLYRHGAFSHRELLAAVDSSIRQYLGHVDVHAKVLPTWPAGYDAETWRIMAALKLQIARNELKAEISRSIVPLEALRQANQVLAWTKGSQTVTPELDDFARYDGLVERGLKALSDVPAPRRPAM